MLGHSIVSQHFMEPEGSFCLTSQNHNFCLPFEKQTRSSKQFETASGHSIVLRLCIDCGDVTKERKRLNEVKENKRWDVIA
jgi:hypothetical protein